jgi:signal transduction histidine kinase
MEALNELFETNRVIVLMVYGQVFFVLGLAIALQSLKRSALALAGPLPWLAAFGIVHGFHEWGYLFVPIQSGYLPLPGIEALLVAQLLMKGVSFALLAQFAVELFIALRRADSHGVIGPDVAPPAGLAHAPDRLPVLRLAPAVGLVTWAVATLAISRVVGPFTPDPRPWLPEGSIDQALAAVGAPLAVGDVLARWLLALPGAALAAVGLLQAAARLAPLARPPVGGGLRLAAGAFAVYAVVGGLIGMPAPFPPASVLNAASVQDALGVPIEVLRSATGLVIAVAIIAALDLFEQETDRALADARRRELLARERERIGRDLHDGIIQSIYAAGLHLDEVSASIGPDQAEPRNRIGTVMRELNGIINDLRRFIFDLRSASLETLDAKEIVTSVAAELRANSLVNVDLAVEGDWIARLTPDQAEQLRQVIHEALSNVLRHAHATRVQIRLVCGRRRLTLQIVDDGTGYDPAAAAERGRTGRAQGQVNMRRRAELLGARLEVRSAPGQGTSVSLTMPVVTARRQPRTRADTSP